VNPADDVKDPPRQQRKELVVWDQATMARAYALAVERRQGRKPTPLRTIRMMIVLAGWCGLRDGEICGLRWSDLDLDAGTLSVVRVVTVDEDGNLHLGPPKTKASAATIPIPRQACEALSEHKHSQDELRLAYRGRWNPQGYVLCTREGRHSNPDTLSSAWRRFVKLRELPPLTLHGLRHSFATDLFEQAPAGNKESMLKIVQERLRHASPATTAGIYLHVTERASASSRAEQERRIAAALAATEEALAVGSEQVSRNIRERVVSLDDRRRAKRLQKA
jgi:integrase